MHKRLASDLTSLAHSILQMKDKEDVFALKQKAYEVYEKLSVLAYVEEYINTTPQAEVSKETLIAAIEKAEQTKQEPLIQEPLVANEEELIKSELAISEQDIKEEHLEADVVTTTINTPQYIENSSESIIDQDDDIVDKLLPNDTINSSELIELHDEVFEADHTTEVVDNTQETTLHDPIDTTIDTIKLQEDVSEGVIDHSPETEATQESITNEILEQPFDELENLLFEKVEDTIKEEETLTEDTKAHTLEDELRDTLPVDVMADLFQKAEPQKTVNDQLQRAIQIGLNDRIAFVKHLFEGNLNDFNRVLSQLNTFKTEKEAKKFITKTVKPDYNWSDKEEYEDRFLELIERRFI